MRLLALGVCGLQLDAPRVVDLVRLGGGVSRYISEDRPLKPSTPHSSSAYSEPSGLR